MNSELTAIFAEMQNRSGLFCGKMEVFHRAMKHLLLKTSVSALLKTRSRLPDLIVR